VEDYSPENLFDLQDSSAVSLFKRVTYVWDAVAALPSFIEEIIEPEVLGEVEEGAWLESGRVRLEKGSRVERGAIIRGPTIIGQNTLVRSNAYIRGHVMVGDECLIGCGTEMRQVLVLNQSSIPHLNAFFTSVVGNRVQIGAGTITAHHSQPAAKSKRSPHSHQHGGQERIISYGSNFIWSNHRRRLQRGSPVSFHAWNRDRSTMRDLSSMFSIRFPLTGFNSEAQIIER
jgi:acetyltransferase-like isoleucine patch superfamily enzyme